MTGAHQAVGRTAGPGDGEETSRRTRPGGRNARLRTAVLAATVDLLVERGLDALSMGEVAKRAGVHESSVYRRWGTKANLAVNAVLSRTDATLLPPDTGSLRQDLVALLSDVAAFVTTDLGRLLVQLATRQDMPEYEAARQAMRTDRFRAGTVVLERAAARGELRPGTDPQLALETLLGPLHLRILFSTQPADEAFVTAVVDQVMRGIAVRTP
ncbi:TetR/AcrR family transcriptional regulator [Streptomyces sp. NPDC046939]|uniref:TetR/AcrR family transcriptional regulator n=1 Tax=Streptomyces sp. NPDC046939 TaxID=3155376 RepID=UPI0033E8ADE6